MQTLQVMQLPTHYPTHPDGVVGCGGVQRGAIRTRRKRPYTAAMPLELPKAVPVSSAPHPHSAVMRAAVQQGSIGAQGQGQHGGGVPSQSAVQLWL